MRYKILSITKWHILLYIIIMFSINKTLNIFPLALIFVFLLITFCFGLNLQLIEIVKNIYTLQKFHKRFKLLLKVSYLMMITNLLSLYIIYLKLLILDIVLYYQVLFILNLLIFIPSIFIVLPIYFVKMINSVEQKREIKVLSNKLDLALAIFWFIGFWFFMPRINKLYLEYLEKNRGNVP